MDRHISLNENWQFCEKATGVWKNGMVPGCVQTDLMRLGELEDLYYGFNDALGYELEEKEWIYRKEFLFHESKSDYEYIRIVFEGVDTYADFYLNGEYGGRMANMFIPHSFDIKDSILEGINTIEVHFDSTIRTARTLKDTDTVDLKHYMDSAASYVRKAHYSFGWDWSPRILQVGLWRPVRIDLVEKAEIRNPYFYTQKLTSEKAIVRIEAEVVSHDAGGLDACIIVTLDGGVKNKTSVPVSKIKDGLGIDTEFDILDPELWFPNGMGKQPLYEVKIELFKDSIPIAENSFRIGIRTVRVIREKDAEGESFIFEINGYQVFAKGANWVPPDNLLPNVTAEDYRYYVKAAKEANFNMFMGWGGGVYEDPAFYDACDEMGIMVWQTFMNHFIQFPDHTEWFQKLIADEAVCVVKQLRNHPSIVLWCGECENGWFFNKTSKYLGNYTVGEIFPKVISELDPSREYWRGTPWGGEDANSMSEGDRHSWDVWLRWQDYGQYLNDTARFVTEFGASSMPNWKTLLSVTPSGQLSLFSDTVTNHCKLTEGMEMLIRFMAGRLGYPKDFRSFCYLSQFNQAEAIKTAVEHWRGRKFRTAGTLFWMYNDSWPTISWSCIDYYKRKKGLYYYARNFYASILPLLKNDGNSVCLDIVNDLLHEINGEARISVYKMDGSKLSERKFTIYAAENFVTRVKSFHISDLGIGYSPKLKTVTKEYTVTPDTVNGELMDAVLFVEVIVEGNIYRNYLVFDRFRNIMLASPNVKFDVNGNNISLNSDVPVFGLFIEPENDVELSDNCFNMEPGKTYMVDCSDTPGKIEIFSLADLRMEFR